MNLSKLKIQKPDVVRRNQPDLYASIKHVLGEVDDVTFGKVAGLIIEFVIQSGGNVDVLVGDNDDADWDDEED